MSKPRFFSVPAVIADTLACRSIRSSWNENGQTKVLLSSSDLYAYGIDRALSEGATELTLEEVEKLQIQ